VPFRCWASRVRTRPIRTNGTGRCRYWGRPPDLPPGANKSWTSPRTSKGRCTCSKECQSVTDRNSPAAESDWERADQGGQFQFFPHVTHNLAERSKPTARQPRSCMRCKNAPGAAAEIEQTALTHRLDLAAFPIWAFFAKNPPPFTAGLGIFRLDLRRLMRGIIIVIKPPDFVRSWPRIGITQIALAATDHGKKRTEAKARPYPMRTRPMMTDCFHTMGSLWTANWRPA